MLKLYSDCFWNKQKKDLYGFLWETIGLIQKYGKKSFISNRF